MFDRVRVLRSAATEDAGATGKIGTAMGHSMPSSSGVGPVVGDTGDDFAIAVSFDESDEALWFHPDLLKFVDRPAVGIRLGGRAFLRDADGNWTEEPD